MSALQPEARCPLDGVRILDLSRVVAGNALTAWLADQGAEVIKVEPPGRGDDLRGWRVKGISTYWKVYARNKKSVTLNLRQARGRDLLLRLVTGAQVLVENFRPGVLEEMGLAPARLWQANPKLVVVRVSGWGQEGIYRHKPGFGSLVEGMSGFASMNGFADRPPVLPPLAMADMIAGLSGAAAVLVALREVELKGGQGQVIDLPLFDPIFAILGPNAANYRLNGKVEPRAGNRSHTAAPRNVYPTKDGGWVALSASTQGMFERLMRSIGRPEMAADPRLQANADRVKNVALLDEAVGGFIGQRSLDENLGHFEREGVTVGPICDIADLMEHPYIKSRGLIVEIPDEEMGAVPMHAVQPRLSATPGAIRRPAPTLGQHNDEILGALGLGAAELEQLASDGVL